MNYLVLQAEYASGRTAWHEVWSGQYRQNAEHMCLDFARRNERPTMLLQLLCTDADMAIPTVVLKCNETGYMTWLDGPEVSE